MGKVVKLRRDTPYRGYTPRRVRTIQVGAGLPSVVELQAEIDEYMDVLLGREDAPVQGALALMETADIYYARSTEIMGLILRGEAEGTIQKGSDYTKFRTGELRSFRELSGRAADLGSRRLSALALEAEQAKLGRESAGGN
jgi:hypothetical protein